MCECAWGVYAFVGSLKRKLNNYRPFACVLLPFLMFITFAHCICSIHECAIGIRYFFIRTCSLIKPKITFKCNRLILSVRFSSCQKFSYANFDICVFILFSFIWLNTHAQHASAFKQLALLLNLVPKNGLTKENQPNLYYLNYKLCLLFYLFFVDPSAQFINHNKCLRRLCGLGNGRLFVIHFFLRHCSFWLHMKLCQTLIEAHDIYIYKVDFSLLIEQNKPVRIAFIYDLC